MQLIRATPQVMGRRFDGVYNDKGILRFESPDAFISTWQSLEAMQTDYEHCDNTDQDSPWYREFLIYDEFERKLNMFSWRANYNVKKEQAENFGRELQLSEFDSAISHDSLISSLLNPNKCIQIGEKLYHYKDEDAVAGYLEKEGLVSFQMDINAWNDESLGISSINSNRLHTYNLSKQSVKCDAILTVEVELYAANEVYFKGIQRFFNTPSNQKLYFEWNIFNQAGISIWSGPKTNEHSGTTSYDAFTETLPKGKYMVYLTIYDNDCKTYRQEKVFEVTGKKPPTTPPSSTDCCKWQQAKKLNDEYIPNKKRMRSYIGILNVVFYSSIQAETINEEKNKRGKWKRKKANYLRVGLAGHHLLFACNGAEHPISIPKDGTNVKRVAVAKRNWQPVTLKKNKVTSIHELFNNGQWKYQDIRLAQC